MMQARPRGDQRSRAGAATTLLTLLLAAIASGAHAQDIEPRAISNAPVGVNFLIASYAYTQGGLAFDTAVPVTDAQFHTSNAYLAYVRSFGIFGTSAKASAVVPYTWLSGSARLAGQPHERVVDGLGDALFRLSVNLYGAPALTLQEFTTWRQDLIIGASFQVSVPVGQYDSTRAVNLGTNRWAFTPQLGVSQALGPVTLELTGSATFFTDNTNFFNGNTRSQDPLYSFQGHAIFDLPYGIWASLDATYFTGGSTSINGVANDDRQSNWRFGGTASFPLGRRYSVKIYGSHGAYARTGNNFELVGIALQYRWGGGL
jgi:hypothetical protein